MHLNLDLGCSGMELVDIKTRLLPERTYTIKGFGVAANK
jgi:hypothetical protein